MLIKLPQTIVFYPQTAGNPDYLLCWIPANMFEEVSVDQEALRKLKKHYPEGLEIEVNPKILEKEGIDLKTDCNSIRDTYKKLHEAQVLPESRMMKESDLKTVSKSFERGLHVKDIEQLVKKKNTELERELSENEVKSIRDVEKDPPMSKGEAARDVFSRISGHRRWEQSRRGR